jgi:hypothetical protein
LCYDCHAQQHECSDHGADHLKETYDHVSVNVSYPDNLKHYVAWGLRQCPGIILLEPFQNAESTLNVNTSTARSDEVSLELTAEKLEEITNVITHDGNIAIARLYLDTIYKHQSFDVVRDINNRLPRNMIALFDDGIKRIKQQPKHYADIALLAIAAVCEQQSGISLATLADWMGNALSRLPHLARAPPRSLEDILRCGNGFLYEPWDHVRCVRAYSARFADYVKGNYNDELFWARNQLDLRSTYRMLMRTRLERSPTDVMYRPPVPSPPNTNEDSQRPAKGMFDTRLQKSPVDYLDLSSRSGTSPSSREALPTSLPALLSEKDLEMKKEKLGPVNQSFTVRTKRKIVSRTNVDNIQEENTQIAYEKPVPSYSAHRYALPVPVIILNNIIANTHGQYVNLSSPPRRHFQTPLYDFLIVIHILCSFSTDQDLKRRTNTPTLYDLRDSNYRIRKAVWNVPTKIQQPGLHNGEELYFMLQLVQRVSGLEGGSCREAK